MSNVYITLYNKCIIFFHFYSYFYCIFIIISYEKCYDYYFLKHF